jgi:glycerol kinase
VNGLVLALDQGGQTSRAIVFDGAGRVVAAHAVPVATHRPAPDRVEHDADELAESLRAAIAGACQGLRRGSLFAAGLATQRSTIACWDRQDGRALAPVLSWQDRRNAGWLAGLAPAASAIRARTGLPLSPHYGASKLRWCLDHVPAVARAARAGRLAAGPLAAFLLHRLLPQRPLVIDPANASRTQLLDLATGSWSPELMRRFGIPAEVLPRPVPTRHAYGRLPTPAGPVPLVVCTGDQSAVPWATGALEPDTAYVNAGTGAFAQRPVGGMPPVAPELLASVIWSNGRRTEYTLEGTINGGASALAWLADQAGVTMEALLAANDREPAPPPLFLNTVGGLGSPWWTAGPAPAFVGPPASLAARRLAVLESVVFMLAANLDAMARHAGPPARLRLGGGLSRDPGFCRALAAVSDLPVWQADDAESTARGLARLVAGPLARPWTPAPVRVWEPAADPDLDGRRAAWRQALATAVAATLAGARHG